MSKRFRSCDLNQAILLPPSLQDWLPEDHLARFLVDVVEELDLSSFYAHYEEGDGRGKAAYDPRMMVRLILFAYCWGVVSSRRIERATYDSVAFRYLAANDHPDHDTIAEFRRQFLEGLKGLFVQVLQLCQRAGLVKLGHVAIDGTKMKAHASRYRNRKYKQLQQEEKQLQEEVEKLLARAEQVDQAEDQQYGRSQKGEELPQELAQPERRLEKIRQAKASLEQEARERAERKKREVEQQLAERREREQQSGRKLRGRPPKLPDEEAARPKPNSAGNLTDADSRILRDGATKAFVQAYNAQAAVDEEHQIIVAAEISQDRNDRAQLVPMVEQVASNSGKKPAAVTADTDYYSPKQVRHKSLAGIEIYIPPDEPRPRPGTVPTGKMTVAEGLRQKLRTEEGRAIYKKRRETVEPVFGQIKQGRGLRQFLLRGLQKVSGEWKLICLTHNLLKLHSAGWTGCPN